MDVRQARTAAEPDPVTRRGGLVQTAVATQKTIFVRR